MAWTGPPDVARITPSAPLVPFVRFVRSWAHGRRESEVSMLRVLGAALLVVLAFTLAGALYQVLAWAVAVGALVFAGVVVWSLWSRDGGAGVRR
ncbi:hypothetical protein ACFQH9_03035 [Pseudonocardia lutea]|uniref:DUF3040 family protein n=2 Tax=Pseudonocardia lutea TaxID=2172015 RepID=A0ABW1I2B7_9PSEU